MQGLFDGPNRSIVKHVQGLLRHPNVRGCSAILMVGGFSESSMLQEKIRKEFPRMKVIIPDEAGLAVLKGAVIFGHSPRAIAERVCKYTYGTNTTHLSDESCDHPPTSTYTDENGDERCKNIFSIHVRVGQAVKLGEEQKEQIYHPVHAKQTAMDFKMFASSSENPHLVTERGCHEIGKCTIPIANTGGNSRDMGVTFMFGGTEIEVKFTDKYTGRVTKKRVDFLG